MFVELSLQEFTQRLADKKATPGGGSAAAMAGAMGAGLVSMFCTLTANRKKYVAVKEEMEQTAQFANQRREQLLELVDRDSAAYTKVVTANRMPKDSEEEKAERSKAIDAANLEATRTPLETAAVCVEMLEQIPPLASKGNPNAISDLKVGMELLFTAFGGGKANVEINLPWLDKSVSGEIKDEIDALTHRAQRAVEKGRAEVAQIE